MISSSQIFVAQGIAKNADKWTDKVEEIVGDVQENVIRELEDANVSIKVESEGEVVEINAGGGKAQKEQTLEELEGVVPADSADVIK
jgi:hypothetical protein